jgi:peroxiredoxin
MIAPSPPVLAAELAAIDRRGSDWQPIYQAFVDGLRAAGAGGAAPRPGAPMPPFALPDAAGRWTRLADLLRKQPLVLSFQRGGWCPYCRAELAAWKAAGPALVDAGAGLVVVTPETGGRAALLADQLPPGTHILCDVDHGVALALGLAVPIPEALSARYRAAGLDLDRLTGGAGQVLPIPATFALAADGRVLAAAADPDFRRRADPAEMLAAFRPSPRPARAPTS